MAQTIQKTRQNPESEIYNELLGKPLPNQFKIGRDAVLQLSKVERDLFTDIEEKESGNYVITGLTKKVSELDFTAVTFALGQILYNQSYENGNEDINSGIKREVAIIGGQKLDNLYKGEIIVPLNLLCRLAYGTEPTYETKKKMEALIKTFHDTPVGIKFPSGDTLESKVCVTMNTYTREKDGAKIYDLILNPIFGSRIKNQFGELPQDIIANLDNECKKHGQRKAPEHYLLIRWLSVQDKRKPHKLNIETLIKELRMETYFRKNRGMAEKHLISVCDKMIGIKLLNSYEVEYKDTERKKVIQSITFNLNPDYLKTTNRKLETLE